MNETSPSPIRLSLTSFWRYLKLLECSNRSNTIRSPPSPSQPPNPPPPLSLPPKPRRCRCLQCAGVRLAFSKTLCGQGGQSGGGGTGEGGVEGTRKEKEEGGGGGGGGLLHNSCRHEIVIALYLSGRQERRNHGTLATTLAFGVKSVGGSGREGEGGREGSEVWMGEVDSSANYVRGLCD